MHLSKLADTSAPFSSSAIGSDIIDNASTLSAKSPACRSLDVVEGPEPSLVLNKMNRSESNPVYVDAYRELSAGENAEVFEAAAAAAAGPPVNIEVVAPQPPTPSQPDHMRALDITGILGTPSSDRDRSALVDELPCRDWHDAAPTLSEQQQHVSPSANVNGPRPGPRGAWAERAREPLVLKSEFDQGGVCCDVSYLLNNSSCN